MRQLGLTHNTKVLSCTFLSLKCGFIVLSIFNDINALKRLHCRSAEALLDVQTFEVLKAKREHELSSIFSVTFKNNMPFSCRLNA